MTQQLILTRGVPASGKTTWANQFVKDNPEFVNLNRDDFRAMLFGPNYKFTKERERAVTLAQAGAADAVIMSGKSVVISDTNLNPKTVEAWKRQVEFWRAGNRDIKFSFKNFYIDLDEALERNALRANGVPPEVVHRMYYQYIEQVLPEWKVEHDPDLDDAIIVDVDGTLADHEDVRSPYDNGPMVLHDKPHKDIIELVTDLSQRHKVIIMTGRDGKALEDTKMWLMRYGVPYDKIYIRPEGDTRKDSIIKKELFDKHVRGKYNVRYVIDDRAQVCHLWRALGLRCLQVADGMF